jgi:hypothetical protein
MLLQCDSRLSGGYEHFNHQCHALKIGWNLRIVVNGRWLWRWWFCYITTSKDGGDKSTEWFLCGSTESWCKFRFHTTATTNLIN